MNAEHGWLEVIKTIGALIALPTGAFVLIDRFFRGRPLVDIRPVGNDVPRFELEITNMSNQSIVIRSIDCRRTLCGRLTRMTLTQLFML
jgi:hypothetical protein